MIPPLLHFVWIGGTMPGWAEDNVRMFASMNPEFLCKVHGEESLLPCLRPVYDGIQGQYRWCRKSDVLRVSVLVQHGGWYLDADFLPIRPMREIYRDQGDFPRGAYVAVGDYVLHPFAPQAEAPARPWIANGVIGTTADSPFLSCVLREILVRHGRTQQGWDSFGPRLFTDVVERFPGLVHVGLQTDWFLLHEAKERRAAYARIRRAGYSMRTIVEELGPSLPYAWHHDMQGRTEL